MKYNCTNLGLPDAAAGEVSGTTSNINTTMIKLRISIVHNCDLEVNDFAKTTMRIYISDYLYFRYFHRAWKDENGYPVFIFHREAYSYFRDGEYAEFRFNSQSWDENIKKAEEIIQELPLIYQKAKQLIESAPADREFEIVLV